MAWNKEDNSFKTLLNRRSTSSDKKFYEEFGDNTLDINLEEVKTQIIPFDDPALAVNLGIVEEYTAFTLTEDITVANQQSWYVEDGGVRLKDWVSDKYGSQYTLKLYEADGVTEIPPTDPNYNSDWIFDYVTGILTFNGSVGSIPKPFKITAYRYVGDKGLISKIGETVYQTNTFSVGEAVTHNGTDYVLAVEGDVVLGIVRSATADKFTIQYAGTVEGLSGLTPATVYYIDGSGIVSTTVSGTSVYYAISATEAIVLNGGGGEVTANQFGEQAANTVLAAPDSVAGDPTFRLLQHSDIADFDASVQENTLDSLSAPVASVSLNSQLITNLAEPLSATDAATKSYVDANIQGLEIKEASRAGTTANVDLATGGLLTIDGITLQEGDRVLVKNQTNQTENGIYTASAGAWARVLDMDEPAEFTKNLFVFISEGTTLADTGWTMSSPDGTVIIGTTNIVFTQFSAAGVSQAGDALTKTGNVFDVQVDATTIEVSSNQLRVKDLGITTAKLADDSVTTIKILDGNITNAKLDKANIALSGFASATASVDLGSNKLTSVADPTLAQDAATKNYVDSEIIANAFALTNGSGTTANGTSVDLGGVVTDSIFLDAKTNLSGAVIDFKTRFELSTNTAEGEYRLSNYGFTMQTANANLNQTTFDEENASTAVFEVKYDGMFYQLFNSSDNSAFMADRGTNTNKIVGFTALTNEGILYDEDYSANYTLRSLVDKDYVDTAITTSETNTALIDGNGTTVNGYAVDMGGTVTNRIRLQNSSLDFDINYIPTGLNGDFNASIGTSVNGTSYISESAQQSNGQIIIVGNFTSFNGTVQGRITRLNVDGSLDNVFVNNIGTSFTSPTDGFNNIVYDIHIQPNDKILVGGIFNAFKEVSVGKLARLNSDGTADTTFNETVRVSNFGSSRIYAMGTQSDGKIVVGGSFTTYNSKTINRIVRLNDDGTEDATFTTNIGTGFDERILEMVILDDDSILVSGQFTSFNGTSVSGLAKLSADGILDTTFATNIGTGADNTIQDLGLQSDGKIVIGGWFDTFNGVTVNHIIRLNANGTEDTTFTANIGTSFSSGIVSTLDIDLSDRIIVSGQFTSFNGSSVPKLVRLEANGLIDSEFSSSFATAFDSYPMDAFLTSDYIIAVGSFDLFNGESAASIAKINFGSSSLNQKFDDYTLQTVNSVKYADDYSPNYTVRSLVDKGYVDSFVNTQLNSSGAILTFDDKKLTASVTTSDNDQALSQGISNTPQGHVMVSVNGYRVPLADGFIDSDSFCIFRDGSGNSRNIADIQAGDTLHWYGNNAGYELDSSDKIDLDYEITRNEYDALPPPQ